MQDQIKTTKFLIGIVVTVLLVAASTYISARDYAQRRQNYLDALTEIKGTNIDRLIYRPPEVLSILVQGKDRVLGNRASISEGRIPVWTTGYLGLQSRHSLLHDEFAAVDYAFVVRIVLSLFVIFLAYNAISGEKVQGTLRLMLSNAVPRHTVLLGKMIGGLAVVLVVLTAATIAALLIMVAHTVVALRAGEWARIGAIFGFSVLYLIAFYTFSLLVSVLVNRPSTALGILLQVWVIMLFLYPNLAVFIADSSYTLPDGRKLAQQRWAAYQPIREMKYPYFKNLNLQAEALYRVDWVYSYELSRQADRAKMFAALSPAMLYDQTTSRLARTGIETYDRFMEGLKEYWESYLLYSDAEIEKDKRRLIDLYNRIWEIPDYKPVSEGILKSIFSVLEHILGLFFSSVVFFVGAFAAFLRKDVR